MEVTEQPLTFVADKAQREIALLAPGVRVVMTGAEALALWTELGDVLKAVYGGRSVDSSAATPEAMLRSSIPSALTLSKEVAVDRLIRGIIADPQSSDAETHSESSRVAQPTSEKPRTAGMVGRAFGKFTGR